ncbi:cytochrome b/b6 domain-containing protein [Paraferrimonas sedimenticola]|uniref:Cytochrome b561 bacterial/Ni-hydrogenase domain-containing protein n=1 Tax=Paraferrimonas sedimenticola TaxID=375674 RepID=A0AA37RRN7_9GAMM|nr:cytochrome b/b6 domain-containing protein [Paraferrimonas sedimenticola]GLP94845.1 hypothetical protein GCM10007895_01510 [Paraferrimonas sedimenticola]
MFSAHKIPDLIKRLHLLLVLVVIWLFVSAGGVKMAKLAMSPGLWEWNHLWFGGLVTLLSVGFWLTNLAHGKWRSHYSWLVADFAQVVRDLKGLTKGRLPSAIDGGLLAWIEGIAMLLLIGAGVSGLMGYLSSGAQALSWYDWHTSLAWSLLWALAVHAVAALGHYIETFR